MAHSLCFTPVTTVSTPSKPGVLIGNSSTIIKVVKLPERLPKQGSARFQSLEVKLGQDEGSTYDHYTAHLKEFVLGRRHALVTAFMDDILSWNRRLAADQKNYSGSAGTKPNSIVCAECDGNGAKVCSQCEGSGKNSQDHFNGQFKAGGLCWLCRGKKEILCGDCNGAGFIGGFMSTFDE